MITFAPVMIVSNMNLHEVYSNLMDEKRKLEWKRDALLPKAIKTIRRQNTYPAWVMYDYKVPSSGNQYIIYYYAEHPYANILADSLCVMFDNNKRLIIKWTNTDVPEIHVLTSHFLQRYKERFLKAPDLTANEVAVRYLTRNNTMRPINIDEDINKNIKEHGEYAGEGFLVQDGFCFKQSGEETQPDGSAVRISLFTTFMPTADMSAKQREAIFEECVKYIESRDNQRYHHSA